MKYLALDVGNVLLNMKFDSFLSTVSTIMNISKTEAWSFLERTQKLHDLGYTMIRDEVRDHFKIHSEDTIQKIMNEWNLSLTPNSSVISWAEELLDQGVEIALVSNMGHEHLLEMRKLLGDKLYEKCIRFFSAEVGARKPSLIFFHIFLSIYPQFRGAVYLDDNALNIEVGKKFGFDAIVFDLSQHNDKTFTESKIREIHNHLFQTS